MEYEKLLVAMAGGILGWGLAQITAFVKEKVFVAKHKKALLNELEDLEHELKRVQMTYARNIQLAAVSGVDSHVPQQISNFFFKSAYKDVFGSLNRSQRLSYQLIHRSIDGINDGTIRHEALTIAIHKEFKESDSNLTKLQILKWGESASNMYRQVRNALWHVDYHLHNQKNPAFDLEGPMHESFLKHSQNVEDDIAEIDRDAKQHLKPSDFQTIYKEGMFDK
jgi:hypothetical protein